MLFRTISKQKCILQQSIRTNYLLKNNHSNKYVTKTLIGNNRSLSFLTPTWNNNNNDNNSSNNNSTMHNHFGWPSVDGEDNKFRATTICSILKDGKLAVVGDGQVSMGPTIAKPNAKKVRRVTSGKSEILVGFAGGTADAMSLLDRLEKKLDQYPGQLTRACVELAKDWRTEKYLRHLQATMIVADTENSYTLTGNGDVFDSADGIIAIGSGGPYALAAARALIDRDDMDAEQIAKRSLEIAAEICVYTNNNFVVETLDASDNASD